MAFELVILFVLDSLMNLVWNSMGWGVDSDRDWEASIIFAPKKGKSGLMDQ